MAERERAHAADGASGSASGVASGVAGGGVAGDSAHGSVSDGSAHDEVRRRTGPPDPIALIVGIGALVASAYVITDGNGWTSWLDLRWLVAGAALLIGVLMLGASLRRRR